MDGMISFTLRPLCSHRALVKNLSTQQAVGAGRFAPSDKSRPRLLTLEFTNFDVLLTVHLSIILVIDQLNAQSLVL